VFGAQKTPRGGSSFGAPLPKKKLPLERRVFPRPRVFPVEAVTPKFKGWPQRKLGAPPRFKMGLLKTPFNGQFSPRDGRKSGANFFSGKGGASLEVIADRMNRGV